MDVWKSGLLTDYSKDNVFPKAARYVPPYWMLICDIEDAIEDFAATCLRWKRCWCWSIRTHRPYLLSMLYCN